MLYFFSYLTPIGKTILENLIKAKVDVRENVGLCRNKDMFGYADLPNKFIICTSNIKNGGYDLKTYVNETVYHEAVHAAQNCKRTPTLGLPTKDMPLSSMKLNEINQSAQMVHNYGIVAREHEAYYLEDKPEQVLYYLKKFCF
jgi:hypothetical protein